MKRFRPFFIAVASTFSLGCFAQLNSSDMTDGGMGNGPSPFQLSDDDLVVVSYHVEERINMKFGSRITTYNVSSLNLVNTNDLGPDNTRVVTPLYGKAKIKPQSVALLPTMASATIGGSRPTAPANFNAPTISFVKSPASEVAKRTTSVKIDLINTYERVLDKGYQSVDLLKKVGNSRFFDGDLEIAAKWYTRLFELTTDLEEEYFYRYAQALKSIKKIDKANEMMLLFEKKRNGK